MNKKSGLGRGLSDLIPDKLNNQDAKNGKLIELAVDAVVANENQPRKQFTEDKLQELAESIKANGVIQPIIVRDLRNGKFEIIAGERRWRASILAGLLKVPAVISEIAADNLSIVSLIENLQREDLNPLEEALAYQQLLQKYNMTQEQLAQKIGKSRSQIANTCRLLNLQQQVQQYMWSGQLTYGHARCLLGLNDEVQQSLVASQIIENDLSVRQTEELIKSVNVAEQETGTDEPVPDPPATVKPNSYYKRVLNEMEEQMRNIFGTQVKIKNQNKGNGKIEIEYYSESDLERILELMAQVDINK